MRAHLSSGNSCNYSPPSAAAFFVSPRAVGVCGCVVCGLPFVAAIPYHTWYNTRNAAVLAVIVFDRTGRSFRTGVCVRNTPQQRFGFYQDRTGRSLRTGVRKQRGFQMI